MNNFKLNDSTKKAKLLEKKYMYLIYILTQIRVNFINTYLGLKIVGMVWGDFV